MVSMTISVTGCKKFFFPKVEIVWMSSVKIKVAQMQGYFQFRSQLDLGLSSSYSLSQGDQDMFSWRQDLEMQRRGDE